MLPIVSLWNLKIFNKGSGFSWLSLSKEDMFESNVLCTVWARVRAAEEKFMAVLYTGLTQLR
jgi:hypothetical protein